MAHEFPGSDWGRWLPRAVADADPDGVDVWYLGCNGFVLKAADGTTLFIDPYCGGGDPPRTVRMIPVPFDPADIEACDAVLATHEHSDHVHAPTQAPILETTGAAYHAPDDSLAVVREEEWVDSHEIDDGQFNEVSEGDTFTVGSFTVHVEGANDPDASHPVSYVVDHQAGTFFHGGTAAPVNRSSASATTTTSTSARWRSARPGTFPKGRATVSRSNGGTLTKTRSPPRRHRSGWTGSCRHTGTSGRTSRPIRRRFGHTFARSTRHEPSNWSKSATEWHCRPEPVPFYRR
jgi:hypothetical protein